MAIVSPAKGNDWMEDSWLSVWALPWHDTHLLHKLKIESHQFLKRPVQTTRGKLKCNFSADMFRAQGSEVYFRVEFDACTCQIQTMHPYCLVLKLMYNWSSEDDSEKHCRYILSNGQPRLLFSICCRSVLSLKRRGINRKPWQGRTFKYKHIIKKMFSKYEGGNETLLMTNVSLISAEYTARQYIFAWKKSGLHSSLMSTYLATAGDTWEEEDCSHWMSNLVNQHRTVLWALESELHF